MADLFWRSTKKPGKSAGSQPAPESSKFKKYQNETADAWDAADDELVKGFGVDPDASRSAALAVLARYRLFGWSLLLTNLDNEQKSFFLTKTPESINIFKEKIQFSKLLIRAVSQALNSCNPCFHPFESARLTTLNHSKSPKSPPPAPQESTSKSSSSNIPKPKLNIPPKESAAKSNTEESKTKPKSPIIVSPGILAKAYKCISNTSTVQDRQINHSQDCLRSLMPKSPDRKNFQVQ